VPRYPGFTFPMSSTADTVTLNPTPCVTAVGPLMPRWVTAAGVTTMPVSAPAMPPARVSVTARDCVPALLRAVVEVWTPASAAVYA